jgi:hypothetical protein
MNAIDHLDHGPYRHDKAGFFVDLALNGRGQRLADLDGPTWQAPLTLERRLSALHQQHPALVDDDGADADNGPPWILPFVSHNTVCGH